MKMIFAIIRPERLDFVRKRLEDEEIYGMTVIPVEGRGDQKGISLKYRGGAITVDFISKIQLEIVVKDTDTDRAIHAIREGALTGKIGDGRIFVLPIERTVRVRTGEETSGE